MTMQSKWAKTTAQRIASGELAESIIRKARAWQSGGAFAILRHA